MIQEVYRTYTQAISKCSKPKRRLHADNAQYPMPASFMIYFRRLTILVMACLIIVPAFSVSFFVRPLVTHTFSAGVGCQPASRGFSPRPSGKDLSRVMRTPFARHCDC